MTKRPQQTSTEEPEGGNLYVQLWGGSGRGRRSGLLDTLTIGLGAIVSLVIVGGFPIAAYAHTDKCQHIPPRLAWMSRPYTVEGSRGYTYRTVNNVDLRLHVFRPNDFQPTDKRPAIVFFFGGGWTWGTVEQFVPQAKHLAQQGMVAAVADYRVLCRDHSTPFDSVDDAREAIRWMRSHAAELGIDPSRIAGGGESAGAHLAQISALIEGRSVGDNHQMSARPDALILVSAPIDLTTATNRKWIQEEFGDAVSDRIDAISPLQLVRKGLPPTAILNGEADNTTPYSIAEEYCKRAAALGNDCRLVGYEGADHGFSNYPGYPAENSKDGKWFQQTLLDSDRFLVSIGYLWGPAPSEIPQPLYEQR